MLGRDYCALNEQHRVRDSTRRRSNQHVVARERALDEPR